VGNVPGVSGFRHLREEERMKRRWMAGVAVVAAAVLVAPGATAQAQPADSTRLKVMTWNLDYQKENFDGWVDTIAKLKPAVAGLQEACATDLDGILDELRERGLHYYKAHGRWTEKFLCDQPTGGSYGSAIISLYPITQVNHERYEVADGEGRGFTVATIDVARIGKIRTYVTHLGMGPADTVQEGEVQQLMEFHRADARKNKVQGTVILGDFNADPGSKALDRIWDNGFRDVDPNCYRQESPGCRTTHTHEETGEKRKLDYIFHKGLRIADRHLSRTGHSDHDIWQMVIAG
jgi:endonuclease/exonuclease/phosphatase family metal-dependent hydrolase